ncbi:MAG: superoxide dismutase family protein, partial [Nitrospirota bacterium]|nr:superoxide dismutase family protein [Nitrospirota bacterium]
ITLAIVFSGSISEAQGPVRATAEIRGCTDPNITGTAQLKEEKTDEGVKEVSVMMMVKGLEQGKHAVHIHETAECEPCGGAGGHFDPGNFGQTDPDGNHPFHSGDLINIDANKRGNAHLNTTTTRVTLSDGPLSLFDDDGSAFIIHVDPDTYCPDGDDTGCAGGGRAACGVIELDG